MSRSVKVLLFSLVLVLQSLLVAPSAQAACSITETFGDPPVFNSATMTVSVRASMSVSSGCAYGSSFRLSLRKDEGWGYKPTMKSASVYVYPGSRSELFLPYKCSSRDSQKYYAESNMQPYYTATRTYNCS